MRLDLLLTVFLRYFILCDGWPYSVPDCPPVEQPIVEFYNINNFMYIFFSERVSWNEARLMCPSYGAQLSIINTPVLAKRISHKIADSNIVMEDIWIGGHRTKTEKWVWMNQTDIPIDPIDGYPPWIRKPYRSSKECLAMDRRGHTLPLFVDLDCRLPKPFMCEKNSDDPINPDVLPPSQWVSNGNSTFILYNLKLTWSDAVGFCRTRGYRLAIIRNITDGELISKAMVRSRPSFEKMWIAGYYYAGHWRWLSTGNVIPSYPDPLTKYPPWFKKHVNRTKGCILFDRHLNNIQNFVVSGCNRKKEFICEKYVKSDDPIPGPDPVIMDYDNWSLLLYSTELSWPDAYRYCKKVGARLAEIEEPDILDAITSMMAQHPSELKHAWLGGKVKDKTWIWAHNKSEIVRQKMPWCEYEEDEQDYYDNICLNLDRKLHSQAYLYGLKCETKQPFVCRKQKEDIVTILDKTTTTLTRTPTTTTPTTTTPTTTTRTTKTPTTTTPTTTTPTTTTPTTTTRTTTTPTTTTPTTTTPTTTTPTTTTPTTTTPTTTTPTTTTTTTTTPTATTPTTTTPTTTTPTTTTPTTTTPTTTTPTTTPSTTTPTTTIPTTTTVTTTTTSTTTTQVLTTTSTTTSASIIISTTAQPTCLQPAKAVVYNKTTSYLLFFSPFSYEAAVKQCISAGGHLAKIEPGNVKDIIDTMLLDDEEVCNVLEMNFWVKHNGGCSELNVEHEVVRVANNCLKQQGFACNIVCSAPESVNEFSQTTWDCQKEDHLKCDAGCVEETILIGSDTVTCTDVSWVTDSNKITHLPSCHSNMVTANNAIETINRLRVTYSGLLFILDESNSIASHEWWIQLQFVASIIQAFPLSTDWPMGLILFSDTALVPVPYNATDTCNVLKIMSRLKPDDSRTFTYYIEALKEADRQIKQLHDSRPTLICMSAVFVSDGINTGEPFDEILEEIKKHHTIVSVGITTEPLDDLNKVASMLDDKLLMYKFAQYDLFQKFVMRLMRFRSKTLKCDINLYNLLGKQCKQPALSLPHKNSAMLVFFTPNSYDAAFEQCMDAGGNMAEINPEHVVETVDFIYRNVENSVCAARNFWVTSDVDCTALNLQNKSIEENDCALKQGFICEIVCDAPKSTDKFNETKWKCEEKNLSCTVECEDKGILIGADKVSCSTSLGWVTDLNKTTFLPYCQDDEHALDYLVNTINNLTYTGILFIVDESNSIIISEWWIQMQFVAGIIQVFPLSSNFPMGLILFSGEATVPIPYNSTDTCKVLEKLRGLKPQEERSFTFFNAALEAAEKQIKTLHGNRPTLIFFISDGDNNGPDYHESLEELKTRHIIISIEIHTEQLEDLNMVASMKDDTLLTLKFRDYQSLHKFTVTLTSHRSKMLNCQEKYYILRSGQNVQKRSRIIKKTGTICPHETPAINSNGITYTAFLIPSTYVQADRHCNKNNGKLAHNIQYSELIKIVDSFKKQVKDCQNTLTELWVHKLDSPCTSLTVSNLKLHNNDKHECSKQLDFICETGCSNPPKIKKYLYKQWSCSDEHNLRTCHIRCKHKSVMVGASSLICRKNEWLALNNHAANFPVCLIHRDYENELMSRISKLRHYHQGFLFVFDQSFNNSHKAGNLKQLYFMEVLLQSFLPSSQFPVGLIMFDEHARVQLPYNETDYCVVLRKLHRLEYEATTHVPKTRRSFYNNALLEARKQIDENQPKRKTLIFFVSNHLNRGKDYVHAANKLKKNHNIFSIGNGYDSLKDLNAIASVIADNLLMYTFEDYNHLENTMKLIKNRHKKRFKCIDQIVI